MSDSTFAPFPAVNGLQGHHLRHVIRFFVRSSSTSAARSSISILHSPSRNEKKTKLESKCPILQIEQIEQLKSLLRPQPPVNTALFSILPADGVGEEFGCVIPEAKRW
jgi:hypothetical protein